MHRSGPHLAFIGMAGVGKSAISRRVALATGREVVDIDATVVEAAGRTIPEIFAADGEPRFRELETAALAATLASDVPLVIATGGGIVEAPANRDLLAERARVVLLHASDEVLIDRLRNSSNRRPLLEGNLEENLRRLQDRRGQLYLDCADLVVQVGTLELADTTKVVLQAIAERWPDDVPESEPA